MLLKTLEILKDDFYYDLFLPKYTSIIYTEKTLVHLDNTLNIYCKFHPEMDESIIKNELKNIFIEYIFEKDKLILLNNEVILFDTYRILSLINRTQLILDTLKDISYPDKFFAKFCQDKREVKRKANLYKKFYIKAPSLSSRDDIKLKWKVFDWYHKEKDIFQFVVNMYSIFNINQIADIHTTEKKKVKVIKETFEYLTTQKSNKKDAIKSLGILMFYYLKEILKITIEDSKFISNLIIETYYNTRFNTEDIEKKVYIRSVLKGIPIFGAKRKQHYLPNQKAKIKKELINSNKEKYPKNNLKLTDLSNNIDLDKGFESFHLLYLTHSPYELLLLNPKYKHLDIKINSLLTDRK